MSEVEAVVAEHPLGGVTRHEALKIYDVARFGFTSTEQDMEEVQDIGKRVAHELELLARAEDNPGILEFVKESEGFITEPQGEEMAYALENWLDRLDRGDSEAMEFFAEWRKARKRRKKQKKVDRLLLAEAGDARVGELLSEIDKNDLPRRDISILKREYRELQPAVSRAWEKVQS